LRRAAQIRRCSRAGSSRGIRRGLLERSSRHASVERSCALAERQRLAHRQTVAGETLNAAAATRIDMPPSTARTSA